MSIEAKTQRDTKPLHDTEVMHATERVRLEFEQLHAYAQGLTQTAEGVLASGNEAYAVAERDVARARYRATEQAEAQTAEAYDAAAAVVRSRAERLAPGLAGRSFDDPAWRSTEWLGVHSRYIRIGELRVTSLTAKPDNEPPQATPVLIPFLDSGNVTLISKPEEQWATGTLTAMVLRAMSCAPAGRCEAIVFDPKLRGSLSSFAGLRQGDTALFSEPLATADALETRLHTARESALRVAEMAGLYGASDLASLREITHTLLEPYRLFVLLDYPYGIDERIGSELLRLAQAGPTRGVHLLIAHDPSLDTSDSPRSTLEVIKHSTQISAGTHGHIVSALPGVEITCDPPPARPLIERVCAHIAKGAAKSAAPRVDFAEMLPTAHWTRDSTDGIVATIGKSGLDTVNLELRGADPALPNVLVGGASGQGKSNLLLVLLHSLAAEYSPNELHMYLLDFKDGLEFDRLGPSARRPHWLPHAKVLGVEGDRLFGLAVLRHIDKEFRTRAERFRAGDAANLAAYRSSHPDEVVPRILVVIDEFQVLVAENDNIGREAIALLETLARRGRAVGIHLVLASQTLSGIETLASKERSIFGQFPWRVSLKTEASESEAVLGRGNTAASTLRFRGEIVLNSDYGAPPANRRAVVAHADEEKLDQLRATLWTQAGPGPQPCVFYASRFAGRRQRDEALQLLDGKRAALLGLPVDVTPTPTVFPIESDPGRTLAVLGEGTAEALAIMSTSALSLAQSAAEAEFVILDSVSKAGEVCEELHTLAQALDYKKHKASLRDVSEIGATFEELGALVDHRLSGDAREDSHTPIYVLAAGMHRAPRLDQISLSGTSPAQSLQRIVRDGPVVNVHILGWWNSLRIFSEHLGYDVAPLVGGIVFLRAPESDVQAVCGPYIRYQPQAARGLFVDRGRGGTPMSIVPFEGLAQSPAEDAL